MAIIHADDQKSFDSEVLASDVPVLVDFFATWCGPCKALGPVLEKLSEKRSDIKVVKVDVDKAPDLATNYGVMGVPTVIVFKNGQAVNTAVGYRNEAALEALLG